MDIRISSEKIKELVEYLNGDKEYSRLTKEYETMERRLGMYAENLPEDGNDAYWGLREASDALRWRMMELICLRYEKLK